MNKTIVVSIRIEPENLARALTMMEMVTEINYTNLGTLVRDTFYQALVNGLSNHNVSNSQLERINQMTHQTQGNKRLNFNDLLKLKQTTTTTPDIFTSIPIQDRSKCQNVHSYITSDPSLTQAKIRDNLEAEANPELVRITKLLLNHNIITQEKTS